MRLLRKCWSLPGSNQAAPGSAAVVHDFTVTVSGQETHGTNGCPVAEMTGRQMQVARGREKLWLPYRGMVDLLV